MYGRNDNIEWFNLLLLSKAWPDLARDGALELIPDAGGASTEPMRKEKRRNNKREAGRAPQAFRNKPEASWREAGERIAVFARIDNFKPSETQSGGLYSGFVALLINDIAVLNQMFSTAVLHQAESIESIYSAAVDASQVRNTAWLQVTCAVLNGGFPSIRSMENARWLAWHASLEQATAPKILALSVGLPSDDLYPSYINHSLQKRAPRAEAPCRHVPWTLIRLEASSLCSGGVEVVLCLLPGLHECLSKGRITSALGRTFAIHAFLDYKTFMLYDQAKIKQRMQSTRTRAKCLETCEKAQMLVAQGALNRLASLDKGVHTPPSAARRQICHVPDVKPGGRLAARGARGRSASAMCGCMYLSRVRGVLSGPPSERQAGAGLSRPLKCPVHFSFRGFSSKEEKEKSTQ
eukprot:1159823-Pelagomonas_calceolata.AAC.8